MKVFYNTVAIGYRYQTTKLFDFFYFINMADDIEKTLNNNLKKILKDNELEKSLTDERIKAEEYKTNYDTLKLDYLRLEK